MDATNDHKLNMLSHTLLATVKNNIMLVLLSSLFAWVSIRFVPSAMILFWLLAAVCIDLLTGLLKSWSKHEVTSSEGMRKTVLKLGSYIGTIVMIIILVNVLGIVDVNNRYDLALVIDALMAFMIFIELFSICENISQAYPNSPLVRYLIHPILLFLKGRFRSLPIENFNTKINTNNNE